LTIRFVTRGLRNADSPDVCFWKMVAQGCLVGRNPGSMGAWEHRRCVFSLEICPSQQLQTWKGTRQEEQHAQPHVDLQQCSQYAHVAPAFRFLDLPHDIRLLTYRIVFQGLYITITQGQTTGVVPDCQILHQRTLATLCFAPRCPSPQTSQEVGEDLSSPAM
jgi:hypothetical protein